MARNTDPKKKTARKAEPTENEAAGSGQTGEEAPETTESAKGAEAAEAAKPDLVVSGEQIRHDGAETTLHRVDVGPEPKETVLEGSEIRNDSTETTLQGAEIMGDLPPEAEEIVPVIVTVEESVETILHEAPSVPAAYDEAAALADAGLIVDMLNGLAEASAQVSESESQAAIPDARAWYGLAHQLEEVERIVAQRRKSGACARKLIRQYARVASLLHDLIEAAVQDPSVLRRHERPVARLLALMEVEVPSQAKVQKAYAEVLRAERRALARARKAEIAQLRNAL